MVENKVVMITGASMGLGFELSKALLREGFAVSICARTPEHLENAAEELRELGPVFALAGDVADSSFQEAFIEQTARAFGRIDAIVNNASVLGDLPLPTLEQTTLENVRRVFEVNTFAPIGLVQKALPHLRRQRHSLIVGISSDAALGGYETWGVYGASKAALDLVHRTLAAENADNGIQVYAVDPSDMATAMHEAAIPGDTGLAEPADVAARLITLFSPLLTGAGAPFQTGSRLQVRVQERTLIVKEGAQ